VGQKTHPTGLRIGINKTHSSTWFANYGAYSEVLKEDYKIRTFFEKEFEAIYSKAGITKLEILRKVNQLELLVHAARPKAIAGENEESSIINNFRDSLKSLVGNSKPEIGLNCW
jgi:small subunit ribosomal protein S3